MADLQPMTRPGPGVAGQRLMVLANAFQVRTMPNFNVCHYDVTIIPDVPAQVNRQVFNRMTQLNLFGGLPAVYDGRKNVYTPSALPIPEVGASTDVFVPDSDRPPRPGQEPKGRTFNVSIKPVATVNLGELGPFLSGTTASSSSVLMAINALNVLLRHTPSMTYASKGQSFYPPPRDGERPYELSGGLEMWGGYFTSIRPTAQKLIVNMDRTAMAFIQSGDLVQVATRFMRLRDPSEVARAMDRSRLQLERFCKGLLISTKSLNAVDGRATRVKKFKIRALSKVPASAFMFENDEGREISIADYFQTTYNYTLRFPGLPCVQVSKKAFYPMEICTVEKGNKYTKKLAPDQVAQALKFTTQPPNQRLRLIREGLNYLGLAQSPLLQEWQFGLDQIPAQVKARLLDPPTLAFADRRSGGEAITRPTDGQWDIRGKAATGKTKFLRWVVVVFTEERGAGGRDPGFPLPAAQQSVTNFAQACKDWGIQIANSQPAIFYAGDTMDVKGAFVRACQEAGYTPQQPPELILTYVPQKNSRQYPVIKQVGDVALGVATQNLVIEKVRSAKQQYYQNVALKVNVKLNGINQVVPKGLVDGFEKIPTIIFGADVGHPGPGSVAPSTAALVASHDLQAVSYSTQTRAQPTRTEIIQDLEEMAIVLIKKFYKQTKQKPGRIIFYRDGVSEGQYTQVAREEIRALKRACATIDPSFNPPVTYIICAKRHHIRFFPSTASGGDRSGNVRAGTVIDLDIVHPTEFDFYLMSHGGLLGTSRPCHYSVLVDENKMGPDVIQQLTNNLAYIYPRSTRSVSIVSPAYFAHHVATRARAHIGGDIDDDQSVMFSELSSGRETALRDQKLQAARERLRNIHVNLENSMYFM